MTFLGRSTEDVEQIELSAATANEPTEHEHQGKRLDSHVRVAFGLSYDGSSFHGFAPQPGIRTVAGIFTSVLSDFIGHEVECVCAGRTDTGVHATAQVVHVDLDKDALARRFQTGVEVGVEVERLRRALSSKLRPDLVVWRAIIVEPTFSARHSALSRRYRYVLDVAERESPLRRRIAWQLDRPVDLKAMRLGTEVFLGEHDFVAFCRRPDGQRTGPVHRHVLEASWQLEEHSHYVFEIEAKAFAHQMVRSIVGGLVAVGHGQLSPDDLRDLLRKGDRTGAPPPAPPEGLCLVAVRYPENLGGRWF